MTRILCSAAVLAVLSACATASRASTRDRVESFGSGGDAGNATVALASSGTPPLRVMTFNIQSARHGLDAVAALIRAQDAEIVVLNEVDKGTTRSGGLDQAAELARRAGYPHFVHVRAATLFGGDYGIALLSRHPILETTRYTLPTPRNVETRAVARSVIDLEGRKVSVYFTHLSNATDRSGIRARQAQFIARLMAQDPLPKMLMGDFNDDAESPAVLLLSRRLNDAFARAGEGLAETYPLPFPLANLRLDYVLASADLQPRRAFVVHQLASDHYPLVAEFSALPALQPTVASSRGAGGAREPVVDVRAGAPVAAAANR